MIEEILEKRDDALGIFIQVSRAEILALVVHLFLTTRLYC